MRQQIDINNWARKDHFNFFNTFDEPYYGVNVAIDCTNAYQLAKKEGISFFLYYLHQSLTAAHLVEAFRLRIENNEVFRYDQIHVSATVMRADGTFGFGNINYHDDFNEFQRAARQVIEDVQAGTGLDLKSLPNIIQFSALPWINFTSLSHARSFRYKDSCPKISVGKMTETGGQKCMPVSIHVNHALVDGFHLGQYIDCYQELMNKTTL